MRDCLVPVSTGELLDKITILMIKSERIDDPAKLANVRRELELLRAAWNQQGREDAEVTAVMSQLKSVNEALWEIEDRIRDKEAQGRFDQEFIELARSVYITNDRRAALKRRVNELTGSEIVEEKSYRDYEVQPGPT